MTGASDFIICHSDCCCSRLFVFPPLNPLIPHKQHHNLTNSNISAVINRLVRLGTPLLSRRKNIASLSFVTRRTRTKLPTMEFKYPAAFRDESVTDNYHGTIISDPYRWLEDPDSPQTKEFVEAQVALTKPYLEQCPYRTDIAERLTALWNYEKYSCPFKRGDKYYFFKNTGLQNHSVLYVQDALDGEPRVFFDTNALAEDGSIGLTTAAFTEDGKLWAYMLNTNGSDWNRIYFKNAETGEVFSEVLEKVKFSSLSWTHDNKGVFYSRFDHNKDDGTDTELNRDHRLYYHVVGTPQSEDILVVELPEEPLWRVQGEVSDCGNYLIVNVEKDCRFNLLYFADLRKTPEIKTKLELTQIVFKFEADYGYITNTGSKFYFKTNKNAPNYNLIVIDFENPAEANWTVLIAEHKKNVLDWVGCVNENVLIVHYIEDVKSVLQIHSLENGEFLRKLPLDVGSVSGFSGKKKQTEIFYQFTSFLTPGIIYHYNFETPELEPTIFRQIAVNGFDPSDFETKQVFYPSKDGTKIPMFIVMKKSLKLDGNNPTLLYVYGGFNYALQPYFSVTRILYLQNLNSVVAIANLRGGGEYGKEWHNAGRLHNKQNTYDDMHAAAEYLISNNYTQSKSIVIHGASNGGLTIGACINQRPELYGAALVQVGVLDLLRYHKFTIGHAWVSDYGSSDNKEEFNTLIKFSPLHNVRDLTDQSKPQYPPTLVLTADHDDRVVPLHSLKFIAQLQYNASKSTHQKNPLLARIETKAGHGGGKPTSKVIEEYIDVLSFLVLSLGLEFKK